MKKPPGIIITHSPAKSGKYIGSPSITVLPDGTYIASHDFFGPETPYTTNAESVIFSSNDKGKLWRKISEIQPLFWGKLFVLNNKLYIIGTRHEYGDILIRRSDDGGKSWTKPNSHNSGLLKRGTFHCAPCKTLIHNNRLWRAFEVFTGGKWGNFNSLVISAPVDDDLLNAESWSFSQPLPKQDNIEWLEGNALLDPEGNIVNILRTNENTEGKDKAAIVHVSSDGKKLSYEPKKDFIDMPGGGTKFTVRYNKKSKRYWAIVNKQTNPSAYRNNLILISSENLRKWKVESQLFFHPDKKKHGWQYVDWLFDNDNIVFVSRTAFNDEYGDAHNAHDANYLTFHRIKIPRTRSR
ncbi:MAG: exo-alpha-sialidase [Chlamydiae bacterium]|nr:MAG: exo-alpha-sialidase [Chlamydiota bacterium]